MPVTIRSRLLLLVLSLLLPAMAGAAWLIASTLAAERRDHERTLRDTARALSQVVDRELAQRAGLARVLAQSRWLDDGPAVTPTQLAAFEQQAQRALEGIDGWIELRAADRLLLDTRHDPAVALNTPSALIDRAVVLPLQTGARAADAHAAVVQPVERQGRVMLNLHVALGPSELQRIVDAQKLPSAWVGAVIDNRGNIMARHPGGKTNVGRLAMADLRARMATATEGLFESASLDGMRAKGYYSLSPQGWAYVAAMPLEEFEGLTQSAVMQVVLASLFLLALAVMGARGVARSIIQPVQVLKEAAARMQAGEPVPAASTGIVEYDDVKLALAAAAESIALSRVELERQVAAAIARTRQAEQRLSQGHRVEALGRLTGGVAHDFNNLLGVISNSAHLIGRHEKAAELQVPLGATRRAVQMGSHLTQHLLRFAGRQPVSPGVVELRRFLPEVLDLIRSVLGRKIELSLKVAPDTAPILVDAGELELALINLALNARDAMPHGGELQLAARNATAEDREDFADGVGLKPGPQVLITVRDGGIGIAPEVAARVFEAFLTTKPFGQGSGMGLSQVHGFSIQAGGAVRLASTPLLGTTVFMLLPVNAGAQALGTAGSGSAASAQSSLAGARVLLVDDNEALGDVTQALLHDQGAHVQRAGDAGEALRLVAAQPAFDVVLTDVMMPGMDGLALARRLRQQDPALAVVLISGYSSGASSSEFPFLRKPCPPDHLLATLAHAIASMADRPEGADGPAAL